MQVKRPKPPENDTKLNPIIVLDSSDEEPKREIPGPEPQREPELDLDSDYDNMHEGYNMMWTTVCYIFCLVAWLVIL